MSANFIKRNYIMSKTTKIRWVIAHEPLNLFLRAAKDFERTLNAKQTVEQIEVEIMTLSEYSQRYNNGILVTKHDLLDLMEQGKVEMSQMYTTWLAEHYEHDMLAFEMPFVFRDHEHAARVLEGNVGEELLDRITQKSNVRGLAYTYSGGFRCLTVNKKVSRLADLAGEVLRSNRNPVGKATIKALTGVDPYVCELEESGEAVAQGKCIGIDTVYPRIYPLSLDQVSQSSLDTEHSLFLTTMIIGDRFWNSLSKEVKTIIKDAAIQAGRNERAETISDGRRAKQLLQQQGQPVVVPDAEEINDFKKRTESVYQEFENTFSAGLIERIRCA